MKKKTITARIDDKLSHQIQYLKEHLHTQNTTQILNVAIDMLYTQTKLKEKRKTPFEILEELNLIGCLEGEPSLSEDYKKILSKSLQSKHNV